MGSHVADALSDAGHETTIFDLVRSPYLRPEQRFRPGSIEDFDQVLAAVEGQQVVYNFAGIADIDASRSRPLDTVAVNVRGCVHVLEACRRASVHRHVLASSIYVASQTGSFYRVSKQACELYVEEYQREFALASTILRYGTLFGRRADDHNSVHRYLRQALEDRRVVADGTGDELREYIHVDDAARLSIDVLAAEFAGEQVVLTGHHPMRYRDLLTLIREVVGDDVEIEFRPPGSDANAAASAHYAITPYSFRPKVARKLVSSYYIDLGQGLLDCLEEIHERGVGHELKA